MDVSRQSSDQQRLCRRTRLRIAVVGGALHGLLALGARCLASFYINRSDERCVDAGPCFAVGVDRAFSAFVAVPLLYGVVLALWAGVLRVLLRKTSDANWRALGAVGFQLMITVPVLFAAALAGPTPALVAAVIVMTVLPGVLAWRSSGDRPIHGQPSAAQLTST
jgi:hypothetical protein